jgi:eukaryotic-like serine/threonine-protein kinase
VLPPLWPSLKPHLDAALEADASQRAQLLAALRAQDPALAEALAQMLQQLDAANAAAFLQQAAPVAGLIDSSSHTLRGQRLGAYTLLQPIGAGGSGSVWLARRDDGRFEGQVAVKLLNLAWAGSSRAERFEREGQILARLTHPHIARLLDAGVSPSGQPYLVLEHVAGQSIDAHCDTHRLPLPERLRCVLTLLDAVAHAHQHLVVHRDIKPGNVMVSDDGAIKLLDFGVSKLIGDEAALQPALTQQLGAMLTPGWAAPEQLSGEPVSTATDVYALGVLLFVLLTGRHPAGAALHSVPQALRHTLEHDAPLASAVVMDDTAEAITLAAQRATTPSALRRALQGDLDNIIAKALRRAAAERYASASAMADDLRRHLALLPVLARAPSLAYRAQRFAQRQRWRLLAAAAVLPVLLLLAGQAWQQQRAAQLSDTRARTIDGLMQSLFSGLSPDVAASRQFTAVELLDRGQRYLDAGEGLDAGARRAARQRMAVLYREVGAHERALALFRAELAEARASADRAAQVQALWQLANVEMKAGHDGPAQQSLDDAQRLSQAAPALAGVWPLRLAMLQAERHLRAGRLDDAQRAYQQVQTQLPGSGETDAETLARIAQGQGMVARQRGDIEGARRFMQSAAQWQAQRGEAGTVDRLSLAVNLGALENWSGHFEAALQVLAPAQRELVSRLSAQDPLAVAALSEQAFAQMRLGRLAAAREALAQLRSVAGPKDAWVPGYVDTLLARMQMYEGQAAAAEPVLREQLAHELAKAGGSPQRTSLRTEAWRRLHAESLLRLGRLDDAEAALREAIAQQTRLSHAAHNSVATSQLLLGVVLARRGQQDAARTLFANSQSVLTKELGPQHPFTLAASAYTALATAADSRVAPVALAALAERVRSELGWQDGASELVAMLTAAPGSVDWRRLPVVL